MAAPTGIKAGYWLKGATNISSDQIQYFTHLFYAFVQVDDSGHIIITPDDDIWNFVHTVLTAKRVPFLSIGGPKNPDYDPSDAISHMANDQVFRENFIRSSIQVAQKYGFSGLDLAWEFPKTRQDMINLGILLQEWSPEVKKAGLLLSARVYSTPTILRANQSITYPADAIYNYLDFVNLILYDYSPTTSEHAQFNVNLDLIRSSLRGIASWIAAGVSADKLVFGIPLYGKQFTLVDADDNGIGAPIVAYNGVVPYQNIDRATGENFDFISLSEYVANGTSWIGYEGARSIPAKLTYAKTNIDRIRGYFLYPINYDTPGYSLSEAASIAWGN